MKILQYLFKICLTVLYFSQFLVAAQENPQVQFDLAVQDYLNQIKTLSLNDKEDKLKSIEKYLEAGANPNQLDSNNFAQDEKLLRLCIQYGIDINRKKTHLHSTPLHAAVAKGNLSCVNTLLSAGANPNVTNSLNEPPLAYTLDLKKIETLFAHGTDPNIVNLLHEVDYLRNRCDRDNDSLIHKAKRLLQYGTNPDTRGYILLSGYYTSLEYAAQSNNINLIKLLLEFKADPDATAPSHETYIQEYKTPLGHALANGNIDIATLLLQHGANPHKINNLNTCPLKDSLEKNNTDLTELLLKHYVNPDFAINKLSNNEFSNIGKLKDTALHYALDKNKSDMVKLLLKYGANPNQVNCNMQSPLELALLQNNTALVNLLLEYGAIPNYNCLTYLNISLQYFFPSKKRQAHTKFNKTLERLDNFSMEYKAEIEEKINKIIKKSEKNMPLQSVSKENGLIFLQSCLPPIARTYHKIKLKDPYWILSLKNPK